MVVVTATDAVPDVPAPVTHAEFTGLGHRVKVGLPPHALAPAWQVMEAAGTATGFQGLSFVEAWIATAATEAGETPLFVSGRRDGIPTFVLPMALRTAKLAEWAPRVKRWLA